MPNVLFLTRAIFWMRAAADWCCRNVLKFVGYLVGLGVFVRVLGYFWIFLLGRSCSVICRFRGWFGFLLGRFVVAVGG